MVEYYSAIKSSDVLHATTGMKLENSIFSETSQTQTVTYCKILFIGNAQNWKTTETESRMVFSRGGGLGIDCPTGMGFSWGMMKMF